MKRNKFFEQTSLSQAKERRCIFILHKTKYFMLQKGLINFK